MGERIGVYGGSFDPPHLGHLALVRAALASGEVERVFVVPVFSHALHKKSVSFRERLTMVELTFAREPRVVVSGLEEELPRPSYTLNTLESLRLLHPEAEWRLIVGADILAELPHWHQVENVRRLAPLLVFRRKGVAGTEGIEAELPEVSSSEVRSLLNRLPDAEALRRLVGLVPEQVLDYIRTRDLYRS